MRRQRYPWLAGRAALDSWRDDPDTAPREVRDPALLKLYCGAGPAALAESQAQRHRDLLEQYLQLKDTDIPDGSRLVLAVGIAQEREYIHFWSQVADSR